MKRFKNILFVVSGTSSDRLALRHALTLSRQNEARLTLLIAANETPPGWEFAAVMERHLRVRAEEELAAVIEELGELQIPQPPPIVFSQGEPFIEVIRRALSNGHDLIIKAAEELSDQSPNGFVPMDMHLLRKCPCPLWLFKPNKNPPDGLKMLAAVDPSRDNDANIELTRMILEISTSLRARLPDARLDILHVWNYEYENTLRHSAFLRVTEEELSDYIEEARTQKKSAFDSALAPFQLDSKVVSTRFEKGNAAGLIPEVIHEREVDLLVMGTVARTGIAGLLIGNTAETILSKVDCSVLAVKPSGFITPVSVD